MIPISDLTPEDIQRLNREDAERDADREAAFAEIKAILTYGYNLNAEQGRLLWQAAFGERIPRRVRCRSCGAEGCEACGGTGYVDDAERYLAEGGL